MPPPDRPVLFGALDAVADPNSGQNAHYLYRGLAEVASVIPVAPMRLRGPAMVRAGAAKLRLRWSGEAPVFCHPSALRHYQRTLQKRHYDTGAQLAVVNQPLLAWGARLPTIIHTDATAAAVRRLGWYYDDWYPAIMDRMIAAESEAFAAAAHICVTSHWAAASLFADYNVSPDRVSVVPIAANLPDVAAPPEKRPPGEGLELLFFGADWTRKRGSLAVDVATRLRQRGISTRLHVCGPRQRPIGLTSFDIFHGFIDKSRKDDLRRLAAVMARCHLLLLPTRADCTPVSVPEAAAFGVPSLVTEVGGTADVLVPGQTGRVLPLQASADEWADCAQALVENVAEWSAMSMAARVDYETHRRWRHVARRLVVHPDATHTVTG